MRKKERYVGKQVKTTKIKGKKKHWDDGTKAILL